MIEILLNEMVLHLERKGRGYRHQDQAIPATWKQLSPYLWELEHEGKHYRIGVHEVDRAQKQVVLSLNGKRAPVRLRGRMEQLLEAMGMDSASQKKLDQLKAPMPGLIHSLAVTEGDEVETGDVLLILEAMKMENVIKSPGEGIVSQIHVKEKESVEKNTLLISFR